MDKIYELKKDIQTPTHYHRAGERLKQSEWELIFPGSFNTTFNSKDWFIDISECANAPIQEDEIMKKIMKRVFDEKGLHSISYKLAAIECMRQYKNALILTALEPPESRRFNCE